MPEGAPALVVRPRTPDEVAAAVAHAVREDLAVSVRSGGHSPAGHGTNTGGMVIDLTHLDRIEVLDAERRLVRVGGGATWGAVAAALDPHGWGLTSGDTSSRRGRRPDPRRRHRLDGAQARPGHRQPGLGTGGDRRRPAAHRVRAEEHPDLFWAIRGGGGNFGVVVDFDFDRPGGRRPCTSARSATSSTTPAA